MILFKYSHSAYCNYPHSNIFNQLGFRFLLHIQIRVENVGIDFKKSLKVVPVVKPYFLITTLHFWARNGKVEH